MQSTTLPGAETMHFVPKASRVLSHVSLAVLKCLVCGGHVKGSAAFFLLAILLTLPAAAAAVGPFEESSSMAALPETLPLTCAFDGEVQREKHDKNLIGNQMKIIACCRHCTR
jgi:hypothetical protein